MLVFRPEQAPKRIRKHPRALQSEFRKFRLQLEHLEDRALLDAGGLDHLPTYLPPQHDLFNFDGYLTAPSTASPLVVADNYLRSQVAELGLLPHDLDNYLVTTNYVTQETGATTLTFQQSLHGWEVANANFNITVSRTGQVLYVGGGFVRGLSEHAGDALLPPLLGVGDALYRLADELDLSVTGIPTITHLGEWVYRASAAGVSRDEINIRPRYVPTPDGDVHLAWNITIRTPSGAHWYNVDLDAMTGDPLMAVDYVNDASYEVLPLPTSSPDDGPREIETDPHIINPTPAAVPSPFGWHDTNGAVGPEFTTTRGNNVNAYADRDNDDLPDAGSQPDGGPALDFTGALVPFNQAGQPSTYTAAAVTNLFYWTNVLHDIHYLYGFDEAAHNFQANNYGRGGDGNDAVNSEAQDGGGVDNANFATPPDGSPPRMQMYEFVDTNPRRDGDFDPEIIIHEYGHGVSNRLTGNGEGLFALQSGGMGEGWSDWWALMLTQESADETTIPRGSGTYVLGQPEDGPGIRAFRYQFDIADLSLETFLNYGTGIGQDIEVHESGTRWAATLWDITHFFIEKYGFDSNFYDSTSDAGNIRALHLIMNALKIQPLNPTFIDARNAILMADVLLYGGADLFDIWSAFARRGLGEFAFTPDSDSTLLFTSFEIPESVKTKVSIADVEKTEGTGGTTDFVFEVSLDRSISTEVVVKYTTLDGSATSPADYAAQSGTLTFTPAGSLTRTVTIQVVGDSEAEIDETFFVRLTSVTNASLDHPVATGTILNDDIDFSIQDLTVIEGNAGTSNAVFTVLAAGAVNQNVTLGFSTLDGTALASVDYLPRVGVLTFSPGAPSRSITVPIVGDVFNEDTETFSVQIFSPSLGRILKPFAQGTIIDNDPLPGFYVSDVRITATEEGDFLADFVVALELSSGRTVSVAAFTEDGTALAGVDYTPVSTLLTFLPGVTTQHVAVPVHTHDDEANKVFTLSLANPVNSQLADPHGLGTLVIADAIVEERTIDDGDEGYTQTAGWVGLTNTLAYGLDYHYRSPGTGTNTATWTFDGLADGEYQVFTRWIPFSNRATNAPFTVLDGATPEAALVINQRLAPAGEELGGFVWQSLGTFQISSGTLAVRLGDNANGLVVADAVRIVSDAVPQLPEMDVTGFGRSIVTGDETPAFDDGTNFGSVPQLTNSTTHSFTISNTGNVDLLLDGSPRVETDNPDDFSILVQPSLTVAPGATTTFTVMFHPQQPGTRRATISISNNDSGEQPYEIDVQGEGIAAGPAELTVDDTSSSYRTIGAWTTNDNSSSFGGQYHAMAAGAGAAKSTWSFTSLAPGQYDVLTTWVPFTNRATNAPFTIADGNVSQNTLLVNQQLAPDGELAGGVEWQLLTSLFVTTGDLRVDLTNAANGFVIADAVRIVRHGAIESAAPAANLIHNVDMPLDVNADARVTSFDALLVISSLLPPAKTSNAQASALVATTATPSANPAASSYFLDVTGDGRVNASDALMVISYLLSARQASASSAQPAVATSSAGLAASPQSVAVDHAILQVTGANDEDDDVTVAPLVEPVLPPATSIASPAAAAPPSPMTVRAVFASTSKKSGLPGLDDESL